MYRFIVAQAFSYNDVMYHKGDIIPDALYDEIHADPHYTQFVRRIAVPNTPPGILE